MQCENPEVLTAMPGCGACSVGALKPIYGLRNARMWRTRSRNTKPGSEDRDTRMSRMRSDRLKPTNSPCNTRMRRKRIADEQPEVAPEQTGSGPRKGSNATPEAAAAEAARCAYVRQTRRRKWRRRRPEVKAAIADYGTDEVLKGIFTWGILGGGEEGLKEPGSAACGARMWRMRSADNALKSRKGNKSGFDGRKGGVWSYNRIQRMRSADRTSTLRLRGPDGGAAVPGCCARSIAPLRDESRSARMLRMRNESGNAVRMREAQRPGVEFEHPDVAHAHCACSPRRMRSLRTTGSDGAVPGCRLAVPGCCAIALRMRL
mgnify:FL=1